MAARDANHAIQMCRRLATCSETAGATTRTFLSPPMREVHTILTEWMTRLTMTVRVDQAGNLRGVYAAEDGAVDRTLYIGSHLDTVPHAGAFDGVLGVVVGRALLGPGTGTPARTVVVLDVLVGVPPGHCAASRGVTSPDQKPAKSGNVLPVVAMSSISTPSTAAPTIAPAWAIRWSA